jgi:signal transduction histidine kinase
VIVLANLVVLMRSMFVSQHDGTVVAALLAYAAGIGIAAALLLARSTTGAIDRLAETAHQLGGGDLSARVGPVGGGTDLSQLGRTLDEMAERLQAATATERQIEASRRDLMTAVSHDLRTPIGNLRAMVEAIDEGVVDDVPSMRRYAAEMHRSVLDLVALVDDLFELAQIEAGAIEAETEHARLADVVDAALTTVRREAEEKSLLLRADLGDAAGRLCSPRLARVLQNLLTNAVTHTPEDGVIRVEGRWRPDVLEVAVADSGDGIAPEDLPRVFEPFFRADPSRSGAGSGLGLALAKRIVEALGGRIDARNNPAGGARFALVLPA